MNLVSIISDNGEMNVKLPCSSGCWLAWASGWTYIFQPRGAQHVPTNPFKIRDMTIRFYRAIPWCFFEIKRKQQKTRRISGRSPGIQVKSGQEWVPPSEFHCVSVFLPEGRPSNDHLNIQKATSWLSLDHIIGDFTTSAFLVHTFAWNEVGVIPVYPQNGQVS